jgi:hypothetical protein
MPLDSSRRVPIVEGVCPKDFRSRIVALGEPLVLRGVIRDWPAITAWTPEGLEKRLGSIELRFKHSRTHQHPNFHAASKAEIFAVKPLLFRDFVHSVQDGPSAERANLLFMGDEQFVWRRRNRQIETNPALLPLLEDITLPECIPEQELYTVWAWFSGKGVRTWLHYDDNGCHNVNAQVSGSKRALLFPPTDLEHIPLFEPSQNPAYNYSPLDIEAPTAEQAVALAKAHPWTAELEAGDVLFIPAHWLHTFEHLGTFNANLNFWWKTEQPLNDPIARRQAEFEARR